MSTETLMRMDIDPEDDDLSEQTQTSESGRSSPESTQGRDHYGNVAESQLRKRKPLSLGPEYTGSRISRSDIHAHNDDHSLSTNSDLDGSIDQPDSEGDEDESRANYRSTGDIFDDDTSGEASPTSKADTEDTSVSQDEAESVAADERDRAEDRAELRRVMSEGQRTVAATIAQATREDAEKGRAVKRQRQAFDSLLGTRMRLQHALIASNSMAKHSDVGHGKTKDSLVAAEQAALTLWSTLEELQQTISQARQGAKRKRVDVTPTIRSPQLWNHMQSTEAESRTNRRIVLNKWSAKTRGATAQANAGRIDQSAGRETIVSRIDAELSDSSRLVRKTQMPRSCAPEQARDGVAETSHIFDDADFYGMLLKEILEQRNIEAASNVQTNLASEQWQAVRSSKTRKQVDTKASKGRKLNYTAIEKLQNFMAPEDRSTWGERQKDELFGSLLGKRLILAGAGHELSEGEDDDNGALMLFKN
ncbi:MAG: rRNA-processing protein bfr2 [Chrysothrix sp. TS-e1954]|nr:MAG: rRNA-processing protein bfr2 [Chrysothrix sp. TS-e1954]